MVVLFAAAPVFIKQPHNKGVDILKNISIPCSASGVPPPKITWSRTDGRQIDFDSERVRILDAGTLFIQSKLSLRVKYATGQHLFSTVTCLIGL